MTLEPIASPEGDPVFVGAHPAIDFLNTRFSPHSVPLETIGNGEALLKWLTGAGLLTQSMAAAARRTNETHRLDAMAAEVREMRKWVSTWVARWHDSPHADYSRELRRLNSLLRNARVKREVIAKDRRWVLHDRALVDTPADIVALIATQVALLVTGEESSLLKRCAGKDCTLLFLDRTKGHRRLFCSASACGNRAKVAAFRARKVEQ